ARTASATRSGTSRVVGTCAAYTPDANPETDDPLDKRVERVGEDSVNEESCRPPAEFTVASAPPRTSVFSTAQRGREHRSVWCRSAQRRGELFGLDVPAPRRFGDRRDQ